MIKLTCCLLSARRPIRWTVAAFAHVSLYIQVHKNPGMIKSLQIFSLTQSLKSKQTEINKQKLWFCYRLITNKTKQKISTKRKQKIKCVCVLVCSLLYMHTGSYLLSSEAQKESSLIDLYRSRKKASEANTDNGRENVRLLYHKSWAWWWQWQ